MGNKIKKTSKQAKANPVDDILEELDKELHFCESNIIECDAFTDHDFVRQIFIGTGNTSIEKLLQKVEKCLIKFVKLFHLSVFLKSNSNRNCIFVLNMIIAGAMRRYFQVYIYFKYLNVLFCKKYESLSRAELFENTLRLFNRQTRQLFLLAVFLVKNYTRLMCLVYDFKEGVKCSTQLDDGESLGKYIRDLSKKKLRKEAPQVHMLVDGVVENAFEVIEEIIQWKKQTVFWAKTESVRMRMYSNSFKSVIIETHGNTSKLEAIRDGVWEMYMKFDNEAPLRSICIVEEGEKISYLGLFCDCLVSVDVTNLLINWCLTLNKILSIETGDIFRDGAMTTEKFYQELKESIKALEEKNRRDHAALRKHVLLKSSLFSVQLKTTTKNEIKTIYFTSEIERISWLQLLKTAILRLQVINEERFVEGNLAKRAKMIKVKNVDRCVNEFRGKLKQGILKRNFAIFPKSFAFQIIIDAKVYGSYIEVSRRKYQAKWTKDEISKFQSSTKVYLKYVDNLRYSVVTKDEQQVSPLLNDDFILTQHDLNNELIHLNFGNSLCLDLFDRKIIINNID